MDGLHGFFGMRMAVVVTAPIHIHIHRMIQVIISIDVVTIGKEKMGQQMQGTCGDPTQSSTGDKALHHPLTVVIIIVVVVDAVIAIRFQMQLELGRMWNVNG